MLLIEKAKTEAIVCVALFMFCATAGTQEDTVRIDNNLGCIEDMLLPGYGSIARRAPSPGSVESSILVGAGGKIEKVTSGPADKNLVLEVETFLRHNTAMKAECAGQTVQLIFEFALRGSPVVDPTVRVRFKGPKTFVIESQPQAPIADRFGAENPSKPRKD